MDNLKKIGIAAGIVAIAYILYRAFRKNPNESAPLPSGYLEDIDKAIKKTGTPPSLTVTEAKQMVREIKAAATDKTFGIFPSTDEDAIYSVFNRLNNDADYLLLNRIFGIWDGMTLEEVIASELSKSEISVVNGILEKRGVTYKF